MISHSSLSPPSNHPFNSIDPTNYCFYCWYLSFAEILEYSAIIIESALDTPADKMQQEPIIQHFDIGTAPDQRNHKPNRIDDTHLTGVTITKVQIEPRTISTISNATTRPKEVVSYQRFGRVDKKTISYPFKCHLCGFSCRFKESLLSHFEQVHPLVRRDEWAIRLTVSGVFV